MTAAYLRAAVILFALGASVGSLLDAIHTHTQTTVYAHPWVFRMAWWTPFLFGGAAVSIGLGRTLLEARFMPATQALSRRSVLANQVVFGFAYLLSGILPGGWPLRSL